MTEEERNLDLIIGDLQKENRLLKARIDQIEKREFTKKELEKLAEQFVTNCYFDTLKFGKAIIKKMKDA